MKRFFVLATVVAIIGLVGCRHAEKKVEPVAALAPTSTTGGPQPVTQTLPQVDTWDSGEMSLRSTGTLVIKAACGKAGKPNTAFPVVVGDYNFWGQGGIVTAAVSYDAATDEATVDLKALNLSEGTNRLNVFVFNAQGATEGKYISFALFSGKTREFFFRVSNNTEGHPVIAIAKEGDRYSPAAQSVKVDVRM